MAFRPNSELPDLDSLKSVLLTSGLQQKDNALWQVINTLIDYVSRSTSIIDTTVGNSSGGSGGVINQSFVTINNDQSTIPNSRQFRAGSGITLMTNGQRLFVGASPMPALGISSYVDTARSASANPSIALGPNPISGFTAGSVIFAGPSGQLTQNNAQFFWNNTTFRLALGHNSPSDRLDVRGAGTDIGYLARFQEDNTAGSTYILLRSPGGNANAQAGFTLFQTQNGAEWRFAIVGNENNSFRVSGGVGVNTTRFYVTVNSNFILNDSLVDSTTGTKCLILGDGTAPTTLSTNTAAFYANDVGGTVQLFAINEALNTTQLTGFTTGSVIFAVTATGFTENNTKFFWDNSALTLKITHNTGVLEAPPANEFPHIHIGGDFDGVAAGIGVLFIDGYGAQGNITMRRANGTQAAPTALADTNIIFNFRSFGYDGDSYDAGGFIRMIANGALTNANHGQDFLILLTANGSVAAASERFRVVSDHIRLPAANLIKWGTTASEVALKRSTTVLQTRLADDSAFAQHSALEFMNNRANFLMRTAVAWTNGAGAAAGTLTNAPSAGDPTKWIAVDDNGTTRHIPAW